MSTTRAAPWPAAAGSISSAHALVGASAADEMESASIIVAMTVETLFAVGFMSRSLRIAGRISQSNFPDSLGYVAE